MPQKRTRRRFLQASVAIGATATFSGTALAGCDCETPGEEDKPGKEKGQAVGHNQDVNDGDPAGKHHDYDDPTKPGTDNYDTEDGTIKDGQRIGHCKYDKDDNNHE